MVGIARVIAKDSFAVIMGFTCVDASRMRGDSDMLQCLYRVMHAASWKSTEWNLIPLCDEIMMDAE